MGNRFKGETLLMGFWWQGQVQETEWRGRNESPHHVENRLVTNPVHPRRLKRPPSRESECILTKCLDIGFDELLSEIFERLSGFYYVPFMSYRTYVIAKTNASPV